MRREALRGKDKCKIAFMTWGFVFCMIIAIAISIAFCSTDAAGGLAEAKYKHYISYQVQKGDTLESIAKEYYCDSKETINEYINEISEDNQLTSTKIYTGSYLIIHYYSDDPKD